MSLYLVIPSTRTTPNHRPPRILRRFPAHASQGDSECDDMLWPSTTPVAVKLALIIAVIFCRFFRPPHPPTRLENLLHTTVFLAAFWTFWGSLFEYLFVYSLNVTRVVQRIDLVPQYGNMFLVVAASCWYEMPLRCFMRGIGGRSYLETSVHFSGLIADEAYAAGCSIVRYRRSAYQSMTLSTSSRLMFPTLPTFP